MCPSHSCILLEGLRNRTPVPGSEAAAHHHRHAHDTMLLPPQPPSPGRSTGCCGSVSSMGPMFLRCRRRVFLTVSLASLGPVPATLRVCTLLGVPAGTAYKGDCDTSLTVPSAKAREEREATTSTYICLSDFTSVSSLDHYKSPGN